MAAATPSPESLLKLAGIPGRGRGLVASRAIKPGEVLLSESPLLLYPSPSSSSSSSSFCFHCFRFLPAAPIPCPLCPTFFFCSSLCLSFHSPSICRAISSLPPLPNSDLLSQTHFLLSAFALSSDDFRRLLSLEGGDSAPPTQDAVFLHSIVGPFTGFSLKVTALLLAKDKRNAFGLMEPFGDGGEERRVRAYGIYPKASFFNHDCLPNACRFDYVDGDGEHNSDIVVRAMHGIAEGGEVCLSYFPTNWGFEERQGRLMEEYGFRCVCDRCEVEKNWKDDVDDEEEMEEEEIGDGNDDFPHAYFFVRYVCGKENCGGTLAPLPPSPEGSLSGLVECNVCSQLRKEDELGGDDDGGDDAMMLVD